MPHLPPTNLALALVVLQVMERYAHHTEHTCNTFSSAKAEDSNRLVHFCHGATGWIPLLLKMSMRWKGEQASRYLNLAKRCGEMVWERGILVSKGPGLCHGLGGSICALVVGQSNIYIPYIHSNIFSNIHSNLCSDIPYSQHPITTGNLLCDKYPDVLSNISFIPSFSLSPCCLGFIHCNRGCIMATSCSIVFHLFGAITSHFDTTGRSSIITFRGERYPPPPPPLLFFPPFSFCLLLC